MFEFRKVMSKRTWFLLFNFVTVIYMVVTESLNWDAVSLFSFGLALLLMNGIAWISARNYKDWK